MLKLDDIIKFNDEIIATIPSGTLLVVSYVKNSDWGVTILCKAYSLKLKRFYKVWGRHEPSKYSAEFNELHRLFSCSEWVNVGESLRVSYDDLKKGN